MKPEHGLVLLGQCLPQGSGAGLEARFRGFFLVRRPGGRPLRDAGADGISNLLI
jgi:hypothetical protein